MMSDVRVGLVGAGTIAETHLAVLAEHPEVSLAFVADPDPGKVVRFKDATPERFATVFDAVRSVDVDLVVVAVPTRLHADVTRDVLVESGARVLVEKPFVHTVDALEAMLSLDEELDLRSRVLVAHHFAFAPEVVWAADQLAEHPEWGPPTRATLAFHDPYVGFREQAIRSYESSWMDSGPNQLSVLARFVDLAGVVSLQGSDSVTRSWHTATFHSDGTSGMVRLLTGWQTGSSSKRSSFELGQSGVELWLDHTAMTAFAVRDGQLLALTDSDGGTGRKVAHYRPLYESLFSDCPDEVMGIDAASAIVQLLEAGRDGRTAG